MNDKKLYKFLEDADMFKADKNYLSDANCIIRKTDYMPGFIQELKTEEKDICELANIPYDKGIKAEFNGIYKDFSGILYLEIEYEDRKFHYNKKYSDLLMGSIYYKNFSFYMSAPIKYFDESYYVLKIFDHNGFVGLIAPTVTDI